MASDSSNLMEELTTEEIERRLKTLPKLTKPQFIGEKYINVNGKAKKTPAYKRHESQWERDLPAHRRKEYIKMFGENGAPLTPAMKRTKRLQEDPVLRNHMNNIKNISKRKGRQDPVKKAQQQIKNRAYCAREDVKHRITEQRKIRGRSSEKFSKPQKCTKCSSVILWKSNVSTHMELFHGKVEAIRDSLKERHNPFSNKNTNVEVVSPLNSQADQEVVKMIAQERTEQVVLYSGYLYKFRVKAYVYLVIFIESNLISGKSEGDILEFLQQNNNNALELTFYVGKGRRKGIAAYHYTSPKVSSIVAEKVKGKREFLIKLYQFTSSDKDGNLASAEKLECFVQLYAKDLEVRIKAPTDKPKIQMINRRLEVRNMIKYLSEKEMNDAITLATFGRQFLCFAPACQQTAHDKEDKLWSARLHLDSTEISEIMGFNESERTIEDDEDDEEEYDEEEYEK